MLALWRSGSCIDKMDSASQGPPRSDGGRASLAAYDGGELADRESEAPCMYMRGAASARTRLCDGRNQIGKHRRGQ